MPFDNRAHGPTIWRAMIIFSLLCIAVLGFLVVRGFTTNQDAIEKGKEAIAKNRNLGCSVGAFLVGIPIVKQPGTSQKTFEHSVVAAQDFLHNLKELNCKGLGKVTTSAINKQLKALDKIVPEGGGGPTANPPPSQTGGGPSGPSPSPPTGPPPTIPPPTTPTTPPPTTTTGPVDGITHLVCHLNPLGLRVCIRVPGSP